MHCPRCTRRFLAQLSVGPPLRVPPLVRHLPLSYLGVRAGHQVLPLQSTVYHYSFSGFRVVRTLTPCILTVLLRGFWGLALAAALLGEPAGADDFDRLLATAGTSGTVPVLVEGGRTPATKSAKAAPVGAWLRSLATSSPANSDPRPQQSALPAATTTARAPHTLGGHRSAPRQDVSCRRGRTPFSGPRYARRTLGVSMLPILAELL